MRSRVVCFLFLFFTSSVFSWSLSFNGSQAPSVSSPQWIVTGSGIETVSKGILETTGLQYYLPVPSGVSDAIAAEAIFIGGGSVSSQGFGIFFKGRGATVAMRNEEIILFDGARERYLFGMPVSQTTHSFALFIRESHVELYFDDRLVYDGILEKQVYEDKLFFGDLGSITPQYSTGRFDSITFYDLEDAYSLEGPYKDVSEESVFSHLSGKIFTSSFSGHSYYERTRLNCPSPSSCAVYDIGRAVLPGRGDFFVSQLVFSDFVSSNELINLFGLGAVKNYLVKSRLVSFSSDSINQNVVLVPCSRTSWIRILVVPFNSYDVGSALLFSKEMELSKRIIDICKILPDRPNSRNSASPTPAFLPSFVNESQGQNTSIGLIGEEGLNGNNHSNLQIVTSTPINPLSSSKNDSSYAQVFIYFIIALSVIAAVYLLLLFFSKRQQSFHSPVERVLNNEPALSVSGLSLSSGGKRVLRDVSFFVNEGTLVALVGPSGSGKSTIVEAMVGRKVFLKGKVSVFGLDCYTNQLEVNKLIGFVPQHPEIDFRQTVLENLRASVVRWGVAEGEKKVDLTASELGLQDLLNVSARNLSGGQMRLLSIAMELLREPHILILDEPTSGLDPLSRNQIISILSDLVAEGKTVLFTTHFMDELDSCDEVIFVKKGALVAGGSPDSLLKKMIGGGKIVELTLAKPSESVYSSLKSLKSVAYVISEGRVLKILMNSPNLVSIARAVEDAGGVVEGIKISQASMKEAFVYYSGVIQPK